MQIFSYSKYTIHMKSYLLLSILIHDLKFLMRGTKVSGFLQDTNRKSKRDKITMLQDNFPFDDTITKKVFYFDEVNSTMDTAKSLIGKEKTQDIFSVVATKQLHGRGTNNRTWISSDHNLYMTTVLKLPKLSIPLTLLPIRIGTIIAPIIQSKIYSRVPVYLKWPNDLLVGDRKICGMLIEIENDTILIGIGCNVMKAPIITDFNGKDSGRPATCIAEHHVYNRSTTTTIQSDSYSTCDTTTTTTTTNAAADAAAGTCISKGTNDSIQDDITSNSSDPLHNQDTEHDHEKYEYYHHICHDLAEEITSAIEYWLYYDMKNDTNESIIQAFERYMDFSPQILRKEYVSKPHLISSSTDLLNVPSDNTLKTASTETATATAVVSLKGEEVLPLNLNPDGTFVVEVIRTGEKRTLIADYLW